MKKSEKLEHQRKLDRERGRRYRERHKDRVRAMANARMKKRRAKNIEVMKVYERRKAKEYRQRDAGANVSKLLAEKHDEFWSLVKISDPNECWLWNGNLRGAGQNSYGVFYVAPSKRIVASREAYELTNGRMKKGMMACHSCDNPPCVNPKHLFAGTAKQNAQDKVNKGRHVPRAGTKVNEEIALKIIADPRTHEEIAKDFGISRPLVSLIKSGKRWQRIGTITHG